MRKPLLERVLVLVLLTNAIVQDTGASHSVVLNATTEPPAGFEPSSLQSPYQSEIEDSLAFIRIPGSNLDIAQSSLPNGYECANHTMTFERSGLSLTVYVTAATLVNRPVCSVSFGDGFSKSLIFESNSAVSIEHSYAMAGVYTPTLQCCVDPQSVVQTVTCPVSSNACTGNSQIFEEFFQDIETPFKMMISKSFDILAVVNSLCSKPQYHWRITRVVGDNLLPITNFTQPDYPLLKIAPSTIGAGFYIFELEISSPQNPLHWTYDFMYARVILPELIATISGGTILTFPRGETYIADATRSRDPAASITSLPQSSGWRLLCYKSSVDISVIESYLARFPDEDTPSEGTSFEVHPGTEFRLEFDTKLASSYEWCVIYFNVSSEERLSTAVQVLELTSRALPLSIICVFNCNLGREMKISTEQLQLDTKVSSLNNVTFKWSVYKWSLNEDEHMDFMDITSSLKFDTGTTTPSLGIAKDQLLSGWTYKFDVMATDGAIKGAASYIRTVNNKPYDGLCSIDNSNGNATNTLFMVECTQWQGTDERRIQSDIDQNPIFTMKVVQRSHDAAILNEPIAYTTSHRCYLVLKLGDPNNRYKTTLSVQITDIYMDYTTFELEVTSHPAFANFNVTPTQRGADLIDTFMATDVVTSRKRVEEIGSRDLLVVHTSTVVSHFYNINLPIWVPSVSENIHSPAGDVLDLTPAGNSTNSSLDALLEDASHPITDPASLVLLKTVENLTDYVIGILQDGEHKKEKTFLSLTTNCITNLIAKYNYVSRKTKVLITIAETELSAVVLFPENEEEEGDDYGLEIENASAELAALYTNTVEAVVPDRLSDLTLLPDFVSGRYQLQDRLEVDTSNISAENATISPEERAYLYYRMQRLLEIEIDKSRDLARNATIATLKIARDIQAASKLCQTCSNENRTSTKQILLKNKADVIANRNISTKIGDIQITGLNTTGDNITSSMVSVSVVTLTENVFMYDTNKHSSLISSGVLHVDVKSTLTETYVPADRATFDQPVASSVFSHVTPDLDPADASRFSIHKFLYRFAEDTVCIKIVPNDPSVKLYKLYFHLTNAPTLLDYTFEREVGGADDWQLYVPPIDMDGHTGIVFVGVQIDDKVTNTSYEFSLNTAACMTWGESQSSWISNKCQLQWLPDDNKIRCHCSGVEQLTFANTFYATPNSIDFSSVFLRFSPLNQAAVLGTLSSIVLVYVILVIWARRKDMSDIYKWGTTPLLDNVYTDSYFYLITVHTGLRRGAGTRSRVGFLVTGEHGDTGDRELSDGVRKDLSRGSVNTFLMATDSHLGDLLHLAVWHDNTGSPANKDWYVSQFVILDILTGDTYTFVCEKWLSLSTCLQMTALANPKDQDIPIENRIYNQVKVRLSESHMWVSIAYRPVTSNFTRVQRASCATSYLLLTMLASAIYFNPEDNYETPAIIEAGPFRFQFQQVYISLISAVISTPVVVIMALLFRRSRRPTPSSGESINRCGKGGNSFGKARARIAGLEDHCSILEKAILSNGETDYDRYYLSSVFKFVAWILVVGSTATSAFFVLLFSMEWGKQKSEDWLSAFVLSLFESCFLVDPVMVCSIAVVTAVLVRSSGQRHVTQDYVHLVLTYRKMMRNRPPAVRIPPVRPERVEDMEISIRRHRNQQHLLTALKNIIINLFFMWLIFSIAYSHRDDRSYLFHNHITNKLLFPSMNTLSRFDKIQTPNDVYSWLEKTVFPTLFPEKDQYGGHLHWTMKEFMDGFTAYKLGPPRLRQLRTTEDTCTLPFLGEIPCYREYTMTTEDTSNSCIGWDTQPPCSTNERAYNRSSDAWVFRSALDVWGLPVLGLYTTYGGGGYVAELGINRNISLQTLDELYKTLWLDRQTRAVILDFTLFCANVNLFVYNLFLVEFPETGGALTSYNIFPLRLYLHEDVNGVYTLICEVIFLLYLLFLLFKIGLTFYQQKREYFQQIWQVFELVQFCVGIAAVVIYFIRFTLTNTTISKFQADPKVFVNFYHVVFWDQLLITLIGVLVFMGTLRMLQAFGTSKRVRILVKVFKDCGTDLFWFGLAFIYMWLSFSVLAYLLFGKQLFDYNSLYRSMATLFTLTLGSSKFRDSNSSGSVMAKIFLLLFILVMIFFTLNLFLSILCGSIDAMTADMRRDPTEDLIDFLFAKIKRILPLPKSSNIEPVPTEQADPAPSEPVVEKTVEPIHVAIQCYGDLLAFELFWESGLVMDFATFDVISQAFQRALHGRQEDNRHETVHIDMTPPDWNIKQVLW